MKYLLMISGTSPFSILSLLKIILIILNIGAAAILINLLGLAYAGVLFKDHHYGKKNIHFAFHNLEQEIRSQVNEDGISHEQSIPYHLLNLETLYLSKIILERSGRIFQKDITNCWQKMFDAQFQLFES